MAKDFLKDENNIKSAFHAIKVSIVLYQFCFSYNHIHMCVKNCNVKYIFYCGSWSKSVEALH